MSEDWATSSRPRYSRITASRPLAQHRNRTAAKASTWKTATSPCACSTALNSPASRKAVSSALQNREFNTQAAGNYTSSKVERTMIIFGKNAINQAYTVNSNFTDATMVMDDREDMLIDVVVGATFDNLQNQKKVPTAGKEIDSFEGCVTVDKMTDVQKAPEHDAV